MHEKLIKYLEIIWIKKWACEKSCRPKQSPDKSTSFT